MNKTALQKVYEEIREYFSRPGAVLAKNSNGTCKYRDEDGNKCAVGCRIPDELYSTQFEGTDFRGLLERLSFPLDYGISPTEADKLHAILNDSYDKKRFQRAAQVAHDTLAKNAIHFVNILDTIAYSFGLSTPLDR